MVRREWRGPFERRRTARDELVVHKRLHDVVVAAARETAHAVDGSKRALTMITATSLFHCRPGSPSRSQPQSSKPDASG